MTTIVTVAASKGGVGKTTLSYELAYLLNAPLIDLDWDDGGATRHWGYRHENRLRSPLLDALDTGKVPSLMSGAGRKPDLLPGHPEFAYRQPPPDDMATLLTKWAEAWGREYVVVDTHPGAATAGHGAIIAAGVVVIPVILATNELNAVEGTLKEIPDYPLLLIPNKVHRPQEPEINRLDQLSRSTGTLIGPAVSYYRPLETRKRHTALTSEDPPPKMAKQIVGELTNVSVAIRNYFR